MIRKKSVQEKLCLIVLNSRSKNMFTLLSVQRVFSPPPQTKFQCASLLATDPPARGFCSRSGLWIKPTTRPQISKMTWPFAHPCGTRVHVFMVVSVACPGVHTVKPYLSGHYSAQVAKGMSEKIVATVGRRLIFYICFSKLIEPYPNTSC